MRALTLLEPWATLIAMGLKTVETRGRPVGLEVGEEFLVHAGARRIDPTLFRDVVRWAGRETIEPHFSRIVAFATVASIEESDGGMAYGWTSELHGEERNEARRREMRLGDFREGRTLYVLANVRALGRPIYARGSQGPWTVPREIEDQLRGAARSRR